MNALKFSLAILVLFIPISIFGQILDASNNVPGQEISSISAVNQNPVKIGNDNIDEYGTSGANAFLGGFSTSNGYMAVPDAGGLYNLTTTGTVEAWIMPTATTSSSPSIVSKGDNTNVNFFFYWSAASSVIGFRIGSSPTTNTGGISVPLNQWSHVAVTWSGTPGNYTLTFYVNGALSGAPVTNAGTFNAATSADSLTVGSSRSGFSGVVFYGYIDELKIWNTARTQAQIAQSRFVGLGDYASANTGNAITSGANYTGLLSSWTFNNHYRDDIGGKLGYSRNGAGLYWYGYTAGFPMPYNYALICPFEANGYVTVPDNTVFNQNTAGTIEAWVCPTGQTTTHMIISRGTTGFDFFWGIRASSSNKQVLDIGTGTQYINTDGITIPLNKWSHIAATWTAGSGNYTVTFYVNGIQSGTPVTNTGTWTSNSGTFRIGGWHGGTANNFNGYIDEVRYWSVARTIADIQKNMFASCRSILPNANLVGAWNFDGNLKNFSATTGIDGSFNTGGTNNSRLSGYSNESTTGPAPNAQFIAHPTVLNCTAYPNGFTGRVLNIGIPDNASLTDTIKVLNAPGNLTDVKVELSIQHQKTSDLVIKLKAPNNTEIVLSNGNGGISSNGYLAVIDDSAANSITSTTLLSPWTNYVKPQNPMTTFGNTPLTGNWILTVTDGASTNTGTLLGWGLRFNGSILSGSHNISSTIPDKFELYQNYPNPFNPVTKIKYQIPTSEFVKLVVYDILGREIKSLVNSKMDAGTYEMEYDASNLSSGVYFYRIEAGKYVNVKKMFLIK